MFVVAKRYRLLDFAERKGCTITLQSNGATRLTSFMVNNDFFFFSHQSSIVKPFKLLETLLTAMLVYTYLPMKELQPNQTILFGKLLKGIGSSSILDQEKDGELVQRRV